MSTACRILRMVHRDDRGALSVLLLLTLLALVALIGLVYNAGEYPVRRRHVQAAADASAQGAALWMARTTNIIAATNMLIVENASAEVIWKSTRDTIAAISARLAGEIRRITRELERIERQRQRNDSNPRGRDEVLALKLDLKEAVLREVLMMYPAQQGILAELIARTAPGLAATTPAELRQRRADIYEYQAEVLRQTPPAVDAERQAAAGYYRCEALIVTPDGSEYVGAPVKSVDDVNVEGVHVGGVSVQEPDGQRMIWVTGGTWGEILCPPLARFFYDRVRRDVGDDRPDSLIPILRALDDERQHVGDMIRAMLSPPPGTDPQFLRAWSEALSEILDMRLHERFAEATFRRYVAAHSASVLRQLGNTPQHVLATYGRYHVPEWARDGVYRDAYDHVYRDVYGRNYERLWRRRYNELRRGGMSDGDARREADRWARAIASEGAARIAEQAATIWIHRTWPYEIRPPQQPVPPPRGLPADQRHEHFTLISAAMTTSASAPRPVLTRLMDSLQTPMLATAQAEAFNWMEYHGAYGAGDRYDRRMPPRPWRLSTRGGWNWQPRLAFSDALGKALESSEMLRAYFEGAGMTSPQRESVEYLIMH